MEERKADKNAVIGFGLIVVILLWVMYNSQQKMKTEVADRENVEAAVASTSKETEKTLVAVDSLGQVVIDSAQTQVLKEQFGVFAHAIQSVDANKEIVLENELVKLTFSPKGGYITEAVMKNFSRFEKNSGQNVKIITDDNARFNLELKTNDNRVFQTSDLVFEPQITEEGEDQVLTMRLKAADNQYLEYRYVLKPNDYMMDFAIRTQGMSQVLDTKQPLQLNWELTSYRNEKSVSYENRYTELVFEYEDGKDDYLGQGKNDTDQVSDVTYIAYKQHFFTSILLTDQPFEKADFISENLVRDESIDTVFTKKFTSKVPLAYKNGEINYDMNWYYGPSDYRILNSYDKNLDEVIPLGWGIFGWITKYVFIPMFGFLKGFLPYGIAIIMMTVLVRIILSPMTYKSFVSQAKMKVLRPEIMELNEKFKNDPMKKQQETMKLYNKAGVNPMAGCIPALLQIPVFYALYFFFPSEIALRQQSFLWADDLSSFDAIVQLPFYIPMYGDHISLFPILASIAIFFYMKMTTGDQMMSQPPQEGMPDMAKIMRMMIYISPIMMMIFFNNFASGLSLYYFVSNLLTIAIMLVIKKVIVKEDKILAQIEENKQKPQKVNRFQKKMQEMMEEAERQKKLQDQKKNK